MPPRRARRAHSFARLPRPLGCGLLLGARFPLTETFWSVSECVWASVVCVCVCVCRLTQLRKLPGVLPSSCVVATIWDLWLGALTDSGWPLNFHLLPWAPSLFLLSLADAPPPLPRRPPPCHALWVTAPAVKGLPRLELSGCPRLSTEMLAWDCNPTLHCKTGRDSSFALKSFGGEFLWGRKIVCVCLCPYTRSGLASSQHLMPEPLTSVLDHKHDWDHADQLPGFGRLCLHRISKDSCFSKTQHR